MNRKTLYLVGAGLTALATVLAILMAGKSTAGTGRTVTVTLGWTPMRCISIREPDAATHTIAVNSTICTGGYASITYFAPVGTLIGLDPSIGLNDAVSCTITDAVTGATLWMDYGTSGDGHDINCLRTLNTGNVVI